MDCTPIFLDPALRKEHYDGFCKQVLWPAFHNIDLLDISSSELVGLNVSPKTAVSDWDQSRLDDRFSDEKLFTSVFSFVAELGDELQYAKPSPPVINEDGTFDLPLPLLPPPPSDNSINSPLYSYTVAVGKKPSHASFFVTDAQEVANTLVMLATGDIPMGGSGAPELWEQDKFSFVYIKKGKQMAAINNSKKTHTTQNSITPTIAATATTKNVK